MYDKQLKRTTHILILIGFAIMFLTFFIGMALGKENQQKLPGLSNKEAEFIVKKTLFCKDLALLAENAAKLRDKKVPLTEVVSMILKKFTKNGKVSKPVLENIVQLVMDVYNSKLTPKEINLVTFAYCTGVVNGTVIGQRQCRPGYWM